MKQLLIAVINQLGTIDSLEYVGENTGQLNTERPAVQFPCALIDIESIEWSDVGELHQKGLCELSVTVANLNFGNTSLYAPDNQKDDGFFIHQVIEDVYKALQGWTPLDSGVSMLTRKSMSKVMRSDGIQEYRINYALVMNDDLADRYTLVDSVQPVLNVENYKTGFKKVKY
jgi:hypothetical protein